MGKMYTFDNKLLCNAPEVRIGDKVYPVDDRFKTVKRAMKLFDEAKSGSESFDHISELFDIAYGENSRELGVEDMPFKAVRELMEITIAAMTGEDHSSAPSGSTA